MTTASTGKPCGAGQRGMGLLWVCASVLVIAGVVFQGMESMRAHEKGTEAEFAVHGHAYGVARAGLVDALAWMRRNPSQPVLEFAPELDLEAEVPVDQTDDPNRGLVRTFEISPGLWGRYVVRQGRPMDPFTDVNANGAYDEGEPFVDLLAPATADQLDLDETSGSVWIDAHADSLDPAFTLLAAKICAAYREALDSLTSHAVEGSIETFEAQAEDLRLAHEDALKVLAKEFGVPPGQAKKLLDGAPVEGTAGLGDDGYADGLWTPALWTRDIGLERGLPGGGAVWRIESRGTVYRMSNSSLPLGTGANLVLGHAILATEVRRLTVSPPALAAICAPEAAQVSVGNRGRIRAEDLAVAVGSDSGGLDLAYGSDIVAPVSVSAVPDYHDSVLSVFAVSWPALRSMADVSTTPDKTHMLRKVDPYTLVVVDGDLVYGPGLPLLGKGILAVRGDFEIEYGSKSFFSGVIYVEGNITIRAPAYIQGTLICTGSVSIVGGASDFVDIQHDPEIVGDLLTRMGQYRATRAIYTPAGALLSTASEADAADVE